MFAKQNSQGLNLIELIVALAIVIILTLAAVPSFISLFQEYHLSTTTENLYYVLQYARSQAIETNQTVYVNFHTGDSWCYGVNAGSTCNCTVANNCGLGTYSAPQSQVLTLSLSGIMGNNISFEGSHGATYSTSTVTFTLYGGTNAIGIDISQLGNMQMCSSTISGYPAC